MGLLPGANSVPAYRDEHLAIDFDRQSAELDSTRMVLTRKEYDLLALLVQHAGQIIPRDVLLQRSLGLRFGNSYPHAGCPRAPAAQEAGRLRRSVHRNDLRHRLPLPAVPRPALLPPAPEVRARHGRVAPYRNTLP